MSETDKKNQMRHCIRFEKAIQQLFGANVEYLKEISETVNACAYYLFDGTYAVNIQVVNGVSFFQSRSVNSCGWQTFPLMSGLLRDIEEYYYSYYKFTIINA